MSLQATDQEAAAVAKAPRVALSDIEHKIVRKQFITGNDLDAVHGAPDVPEGVDLSNFEALTLCLVTMTNGFTVIGKSAPASPENFNAELGQKFAYEDAVRQLWPLEGYALCDQLRSQEGAK